MRRKKQILLIFVLIGICLSIFISAQAKVTLNLHENQAKVQIRFIIYVFDINPSMKSATVRVGFWFDNIYQNATEFDVIIRGGGETNIQCFSQGRSAEGFSYRGFSNFTTWYLDGIGEAFPFDSYWLVFYMERDSVQFKVANTTYSFDNEVNYTISTTYSVAYLNGSSAPLLRNYWKTEGGAFQLPIVFVSDYIYVQLERKSIVPFCQFMLPIIACFYLLAFSPLIRKDRLSDRLLIYLSLFIFAPTFLFSIQSALPARSYLSVPEYFLTLLVTSTIVFAIFSMLSQRFHLQEHVPEFFAYSSSSFLHLFLFLFSFPIGLGLMVAITFAVITIPAFAIPAIVLAPLIYRNSRKQKRKNETFPSPYV